MSWLFFALFAPLLIASWVKCGDDSMLRKMWSPPKLGPDDRRALSRFLRAKTETPSPELAEVARTWAEDTVRPPCKWDRYLNRAFVVWFSAGVVIAIAFGTAANVAARLILLDLILGGVLANQRLRRRAAAILAR